MSEIKTFSEYENMFFETIKDKTVGELLDACSSPDTYPNAPLSSHQGLHLAAIRRSGLESIPLNLRKDFFEFALNEKGFRDIPILGGFYDDERDCILYAVQELFKVNDISTYKVIYFDYFDGCFAVEHYRSDYINRSPLETIYDLYLDTKGPFE